MGSPRTMLLEGAFSGVDNYDHEFNVVFVGEKGAGKTALIWRLIFNSFVPHLPPVIVCWQYVLERVGRRVKVNIRDTPGIESVDALSRSWLRNAHAIVVVFDPTNRDQKIHLNEWISAVLRPLDESTVFSLVVGSKKDLCAVVGTDELSEFERRNTSRIPTCRTSAASGRGVQRMLRAILDVLLYAKELTDRLGELSARERADEEVTHFVRREFAYHVPAANSLQQRIARLEHLYQAAMEAMVGSPEE